MRREVRRGRRYDGIILDPPKFGRGPNGETWRIENDLAELLLALQHAACARDANDAASAHGFFIATVYAVRLSYLALGQLAREALCWRCRRLAMWRNGAAARGPRLRVADRDFRALARLKHVASRLNRYAQASPSPRGGGGKGVG